MNGVHHTKGHIDCLYLPIETWLAKGLLPYLMLLSVNDAFYPVIYFVLCTTEPLLQCARNVPIVPGKVGDFVTEAHQQRLTLWKTKALHGEIVKKVGKGGKVSISFQWLVYGRLKIQTEAQVVVAQDQLQALAVQTVQNSIYGLSVPVSCRVCGLVPEYADHFWRSCNPLAITMYMHV